MKLYDYYRSSAAYRVRIALNLKGVDYQQCPVSLLDNEQSSDSYLKLNPIGLVPSLNADQGMLSQSLAIIEYLEERFPQPALLPHDLWQKAQCRSLALLVACDIHPLNNLRVLNYLNTEFGVKQNEKMIWYHHWLHQGFRALEAMLQSKSSTYCCGDSPTLADICLVPQMYNARRFELSLTDYPTLIRIDNACNRLDAFAQAHPDKQQG